MLLENSVTQRDVTPTYICCLKIKQHLINNDINMSYEKNYTLYRTIICCLILKKKMSYKKKIMSLNFFNKLYVV